MVAQVSSETFTLASHTPEWESSDSDDLVLALETARALEAQGELREAARWLGRAADQAEQDGNDDQRVLALARAAADLANLIGPASSPVPAPSAHSPSTIPAPASERAPAPKPAPWAHAPPAPPPAPVPRAPSRTAPASTPSLAKVSLPPPVPARASSSPPPTRPSPPRAVASAPASSRPVPAKPAAPSLTSARVASGPAATTAVKPTAGRKPAATIRVAIPASMRDPSIFVVRRLAKGQPLPPDTKEATLVLSEDDGSIS